MNRLLIPFAVLALTISAPSQIRPPMPPPGGERAGGKPEEKEKDRDKDKDDEKKKDKDKEKEKEKPKEQGPKETTGKVIIGGKEITYLAKVGTLPLLKDDGSPKADMFYVYYAATGGDGKPLADSDSSRPIMFCFNGGPGSAAVWLHFGGLGPKKIQLPPDGKTHAMLGAIADNPNSILDATDLVFLDPVGTGGSRPAKGEKGEQFWGVEEDIEACGEFIRTLTTKEERWMSPKYLCGESYGGLRGAGLSDYLQGKHGMMLAGFVCVSGVLNFATLTPDTANDLPYMTFLPTMAATAHYHGKIAGDLEKIMTEAREFAFGDYALALMKGRQLPAERRRAIAEKLAHFTGLSVEDVEAQELRVSPSVFRELLLRKEGKIIGRYDARVISEDGDRSELRPEFDPSYTNVVGPFSAMANTYLRATLGWESEHPYRVLGGLPWNYSRYANRYAGTDRGLATAMKTNPDFRILVCGGVRDLAVPPDATRFSLDHLDIPERLRSNIIYTKYESGHMMYLLESDAVKLRNDIKAFVERK